MEERPENAPSAEPDSEKSTASTPKKKNSGKPQIEIGGPEGPEPTRYGDWERNGRVSDF